MRVLLVDDHPLFVEGLQCLLAVRGIEVAGTAHDGFEALAQARALRPDVILMDIQMPRCDGLTATRLIRAEMPEVKIVVLTVSEEDDDLFEAIRSGASGYVVKSLSADTLLTLLMGLERGEVPLSPGLAARILAAFASTGTPASGSQGPGGSESTPGAEAGALSPRQVQVLTLVAQGLPYREVATVLCLTERTIKYHMGEILQQLHLRNRAEAIGYAARLGLARGPAAGAEDPDGRG